MMTPLERARHTVQVLKNVGIRPTDEHFHVGENGVRCEFCELPLDAAVHDPERMGRGGHNRPSQSRHLPSFIPPEAKDIEANKAREPQGERLRAELTEWLAANGISGILLDTEHHRVDIQIDTLPPEIRSVLTIWGSIYVNLDNVEWKAAGHVWKDWASGRCCSCGWSCGDKRGEKLDLAKSSINECHIRWERHVAIEKFMEGVRTLQAVSQRVETGPVRFGDDWPGVFIRGDNAFGYAMSLQRLLDRSEWLVLDKAILRGLIELLQSSNINQTLRGKDGETNVSKT